MKLHRTVQLSAAAGLVVALGLGVIGSADAGEITAHSVRKIAAKVVVKQATTLSVAEARNATSLDGRPASAYQDTATVYSAAVTTPVSSVTLPFAVTPGSNEISYSAYLDGAGPGDSGCYVEELAADDIVGYYADEESYKDSTSPAYSAAGVVTISAGQTLQLYCFAATPFTTLQGNAGEPIQISVTPLDSATTTLIVPSPALQKPAARRR